MKDKNRGEGTVRTEELLKSYQRIPDKELIKIGLLEKYAQSQPKHTKEPVKLGDYAGIITPNLVGR